MFVKKEIPASSPAPAYDKELEYLYARRLAVDTLIDSLEQYNRYRVTGLDDSERQTA